MYKRHYKNWLAAYTEYTQISESPASFHFWTGTAVLSGALQRKVWIDMGYFDWVPNMYVILVAPPGISSKSTTVNIGMSMLRQIESVKFGASALTWQSLVQAFADAKEAVDYNDPNSGSPFFLQSALTCVASELGTFLDPSNRDLVDVLTSLWDGQRGTFDKSTKTQGSESIQNPIITFVGCTTPAWLSQHVPESLVGGGFTSRCIFLFADKKRQLIAYPGRHMDEKAATMRAKLVEDLEHISQLVGPMKLTQEAYDYGIEWYAEHYEHPPEHLKDNRFGGYLARKQTHIHKLAMILSVAQRDDLVINKLDLHTATEIVSATEASLPAIFLEIGKSQEGKISSELVSHVRAYGTIPYDDLYAKMFRVVSFKDFQAMVNSAIRAGQISPGSKGGRQVLSIN